MHVDHLIFAAGPDGLRADAEELAATLGTEFKDGGFHPRFGTRNHIIPLAEGRYIEIVEVLDHPAAEKAPFGQAVRARSEAGGGWLGWAAEVSDISIYEQRLGRSAVLGSRHFPDGRLLEWKQLGVCGLMADPQLPMFLEWISEPSVRPCALSGTVKLVAMDISGSKERVADWLAIDATDELDGVQLRFAAPHGQPGITRVIFETADGTVEV